MRIKAFSALTQLSAHTLRYYEKMGLLDTIKRDASGHRLFSSRDVAWVEFVVRLKQTGMALADIRAYAELRAQGAATHRQRQQMLAQHRVVLSAQIDQAQEHLKELDLKIQYYHDQIDDDGDGDDGA
jgi:DNA-binding transcriptional MerR regulator